MSKAILVLGATGQQGGAVISNLIRENADVIILAVTRSTSSSSAQKLQQKSPKIKLIQGDQNDAAALFKSAKEATSLPIWGVFSVQPVAGEKEETLGKAIVDEALKAGVKLFVYSSVDRDGGDEAKSPTNIPHFITKHNIEEHLLAKAKGSDMEWTILRPVAFLDNLQPNFFGKVFATSFKMSLKGRPLQLIAVEDIGFFGAQAFLKPEEFKGKYLSLAGDSLTFNQFAQIFKEKTGQDVPLTFEFVCSLIMYFVKEFGYMFTWFHEKGFTADIEALRKIHPGLKDFKTWLEKDSQWTMKA